MKRKIGILIATGIIIFSFSKICYADEVSALKAEIQAMEERHQKEITELRSRIKQLETEKQAKIKAPKEVEDRIAALEEKLEKKKDQLGVSWKDGLYISSEDKQFDMSINGKLQVDSAWFGEENSLRSKVGAAKSRDQIRRSRLQAKGTMYGDGIYKFEYEFAGDTGKARVQDAFIGWKNIPYIGMLRLGHMFEPMGRENLTSNSYLTFMEYGLPYALMPGRNLGIQSNSTFFNDALTLALGVFRDTDDYGMGTSNKYNFGTRITATPIYKNKGEEFLHLGFSYSNRKTNGTLQYRSKPESNLAPYFVDTGVFSAKKANLYGLETAYIRGPLSFEAEYAGSSVDRKGNEDVYFQGLYGLASYFFTGETRAYSRSTGEFLRVRPKHNFSLKDKTWGAWEAALRYSYLDLDENNINGGILSDVTFGLNWYLNPNMRMMFNYIFANRNGYGDADILQTRFQVDF
ncbi:MAG: porin [Candidatus Omnitrophota bacterium]|nr:porin [Candidatus Omnitrophota bacterium]